MLRPKASVYLLAPMIVAVAALSACSSQHAQEENLVRQYFRASGLRDNQTLANFAVVSFDPKTEGTVTDFEVTAVSPERTEPLQIIALSKALSEAEAANKAFTERKKQYQDANIGSDRSRVEGAGRREEAHRQRWSDSGRVGEMAGGDQRRSQETVGSEKRPRRRAADRRAESVNS